MPEHASEALDERPKVHIRPPRRLAAGSAVPLRVYAEGPAGIQGFASDVPAGFAPVDVLGEQPYRTIDDGNLPDDPLVLQDLEVAIEHAHHERFRLGKGTLSPFGVASAISAAAIAPATTSRHGAVAFFLATVFAASALLGWRPALRPALLTGGGECLPRTLSRTGRRPWHRRALAALFPRRNTNRWFPPLVIERDSPAVAFRGALGGAVAVLAVLALGAVR